MFELPTIMVNFKTYEQASGNDALNLVRICKKASEETGINVSCCVQSSDINKCASAEGSIAVFAQHIDTEKAGGHTGKIHIKSVFENGAVGSLINHSEDRVDKRQIEESVSLLDKKDMVSVVCVQDASEARDIAHFKPDIIAIEPPELIGGDVSVTSADPDIISQTIDAVRSVDSNIPILCGAGVKTGDDVKKALDLGAMGVLVASGVTKADDQERAVKELIRGVSEHKDR
ncbi:MAG: triose-phosphate isomerase [Nanoarchaeota archaeon]